MKVISVNILKVITIKVFYIIYPKYVHTMQIGHLFFVISQQEYRNCDRLVPCGHVREETGRTCQQADLSCRLYYHLRPQVNIVI